jgi:hypothetical protein
MLQVIAMPGGHSPHRVLGNLILLGAFLYEAPYHGQVYFTPCPVIVRPAFVRLSIGCSTLNKDVSCCAYMLVRDASVSDTF